MQGQARFKYVGRASVRTIVAAVTVLAATAPASAQPKKSPAPEPQVVQFTTEDNVVIEADYYPPSVADPGKAPAAILIHMYPADRASWKPLVPSLRKAGFAVLAYDIRGTGGSLEPKEKKLKQCYIAKDPEHFNDAWKDVRAAKEWLAGRDDCDTSRIALIGASIGSSISLHYGSQDEDVKAIVCLSPGTDYFGLDSVSHIKQCGKRGILLISPESEYETVKKLIMASNRVAKGKKYVGTRKQHGTNLFKSKEAKKVKRRISTFLKKALPPPKTELEERPEPPGKKKKPRAKGI